MALLLLPMFGACNLITGEEGRIASRAAGVDAGSRKVDANEPDPVDPPLDAGADAPEALTITVPPSWRSPNDAGWIVDGDGGTKITSFGAGHAVLLPVPDVNVTAEDYTLSGTVLAQQDGEYGFLVRVQPDGAGVLIGSKFGNESKPFLGSMSPPDWAPSDDRRGGLYTFVTGTRYRFKLRARGDEVSGKMWAGDLEPTNFQLTTSSPWRTGRGVGYYTYGIVDVVLESVQITVP
jgi:hypothetical protein